MIFAGILAALLVSPFLSGILQGDGLGTGQFPVIFEIRTVLYLETFIKGWSLISRSLLMLAALPVIYFVELGFFFLVAICWFLSKGKEALRSNPYYLSEIILLVVVLITTSFLRSTAGNNDLGWRSWLPGQFLLLVWGVDVIEIFLNKKNNAFVHIKPINGTVINSFLRASIIIGILTMGMNVIFTRIYYPAMSGSKIGKQAYSARLAYEYVSNHVPSDIIVQNNPVYLYDGTSGLYGTHQMVAYSYFLIPYGISLDAFNKLANEVETLFSNQNTTNWRRLDRICRKYLIGVLIMKNTDPVWSQLATLEIQRPALYKNTHYALFACGDYAGNAH